MWGVSYRIWCHIRIRHISLWFNEVWLYASLNNNEICRILYENASHMGVRNLPIEKEGTLFKHVLYGTIFVGIFQGLLFLGHVLLSSYLICILFSLRIHSLNKIIPRISKSPRPGMLPNLLHRLFKLLPGTRIEEVIDGISKLDGFPIFCCDWCIEIEERAPHAEYQGSWEIKCEQW